MTAPLTHGQLLRWRAAIFAVFLASGLSIATWSARVPAIKSALHVTRGDIGLMLFVGGVASIVGLSASSMLLIRWGARRGMLTMVLVFATGVTVIGLGADLAHSWAVVTAGLALWGFGNGCLDVMMNVQGAAIEKRMGRTMLPLFHAFFSFGTVIGAGLGVAAIALHLPPDVHLPVMAALIAAIAVVAVANVPRREQVPDSEPVSPLIGDITWRDRLHLALSAWREPRTYALGVVMLGMSFAEGGANDWIALAVSNAHGAGQAMGAAALAVFSVCMTAMRALGSPLVDRIGRVAALRILAVTATAGLLLFILAPNLPLVFAGAALWGLGASLGFPLGMSAAADDPLKAAVRVSAAATIGYVSFLAGPPLLGFVSEHIGLLNTLYILVALTIASLVASGAARPMAGSTVGAGRSPSPAAPDL